MQPLTDRQQQVLSFISSYIDNNSYPPSQREIADHLGVSSNPGIIKHLDALEKKGYLKRNSNSRSIVLTASTTDTVSLPIIGTVRAGQLSLAVEDIQGYLSLDSRQAKGAHFLVRVIGDSMKEAAILENDLALIRPQTTADNRDVVVAMIDGEATLKEFYREQGQIRLQPRNSSMEPIIIREGEGEVTILGRVVGILRSLA